MKQIAAFCFSAIMFVGFAQANEQPSAGQSSVRPNGVIGPNTYEECLALTMWTYSGKSINEMVDAAKDSDQQGAAVKPMSKNLLVFGHSAGTVKIPKGWSVVGTAARNDGEPLLFICH